MLNSALGVGVDILVELVNRRIKLFLLLSLNLAEICHIMYLQPRVMAQVLAHEGPHFIIHHVEGRLVSTGLVEVTLQDLQVIIIAINSVLKFLLLSVAFCLSLNSDVGRTINNMIPVAPVSLFPLFNKVVQVLIGLPS